MSISFIHMQKIKVSHKIITLIICLMSMSTVSAQQTLDRIVGIIGDEVVLQSDVDNQYNYLKINGQKDDGTLQCAVLENLIMTKLLLDKARQDSLVVNEAQVEAEVERRVGQIMEDMGSRGDFEKIYGKSIIEFKVDITEDIRNQMLVDQQRQSLLSEATITPREVKSFYRSVDPDSLGLLPAEVQLNHIVVIPPFSKESKEAATQKLEGIRKRIVDENEDFATLAKQYSMGPSNDQGGLLGDVTRGMMVPQFEEVIYSLRIGEVSDVFLTEYGYHIAKVNDRRGEIVNASHILLIPRRSANGDSVAMARLNRIYELIGNDSITFEQAAIRFSEDRQSKDCGGCISNPRNNELRVPMDMLDADMFFKIDEMAQGEISKPMEHTMPDGTRAFHLLYLKSKIPPHTPNLKDDYQKIHDAALQMKQAESFEKWLLSAKENIYIDIKPNECSNALKYWME